MNQGQDDLTFEAHREAINELRREIELRVAEVVRLFGAWGGWHADCAAFGKCLHDIVADAKERTRRSRHPRLHSKGRRSRWPRGVRA